MRSVLRASALMAVLASPALVSPARATELIVNGGFETNTGNGQVGYDTTITGWTMASSSSYTFLFGSGTADTTGAVGQYGLLKLWGSGDGSNNGLTASSPAGGYYIAQDSAYQSSAITQTVTGLIVGATYELSFWWAAGQQAGFSGSTYDSWEVSLGSETYSTATVDVSSHGFSGWMLQTFTFTATSTSELLSFLAVGGPAGVPPFALLDDVSLEQVLVPEPATWGLLLGGVGAVGFLSLRGRRQMRNAA